MNIDWSKAPEGATHWVGGIGPWHKHIDNVSWYWHKPGNRWLRIGVPAEQVEVEYIDTIVKRPDEPWTGTGLPPVGTVCEYYIDDDKWRQCEIVAHKDGYAVIWITAAHVFSARSSGLLRPIRTQAQIEAEERENYIGDLACHLMMHAVGNRLPMSEDGARKLAQHLYLDGYRKQPKEGA